MANVLILGGVGFIGRNLVCHLVKEGKCAKIRVADKMLPMTAGLSDEQKKVFESDAVEFVQANLSNDASIAKVFSEEAPGAKWDYVINLAGETKYSQTEAVYKDGIVSIAEKCAAASKKLSALKRFVEVSTGQVYESGKKASGEDAKVKPWTELAKAKVLAEEAVKKSGVPYTILRCAIVYGPGDVSGITPRLICAATYTKTKEKMVFLWEDSMKIHTVHVDDVCGSIWHCCESDDVGKDAVLNVVDESDTTQGDIAKIIESIFSIKTTFMGNMKSKLATSVAMKTVANTANETHMQPWSELCKEQGITNTPLTPYLDEELLYNNPLCLDGQKLKKSGYDLKVPKLSEQSLRDVLDYFQKLNAFPSLSS